MLLDWDAAHHNGFEDVKFMRVLRRVGRKRPSPCLINVKITGELTVPWIALQRRPQSRNAPPLLSLIFSPEITFNDAP
jgi:hypothetical protein